MATPLLGLALPTTGSLTGAWGATVNNSITSLLDSAVAGTTTLSTDGDVTLTTTIEAANQARQSIILWTAAGTVTRYITAPAQSKTYIIINTSGTQSIVLRGVGPTTGITIIAGEKALCAWNGSDFVKIASSIVATGTVTSVGFTGGLISVATATTTPALTVAGTSGGVVYFASGSTWASTGALTSNALMVGGGAGAGPSTVTTGTGVVTALGVNTGSAGAFVVNGGALGTPSSGTVTNLTGTASININGTVGATTTNTGAFSSLGVGTAASGTTGEIRATNNITAYYSDDRLKTRLGNIENALDKVTTLDAFYYEANEVAQGLGYEPVREVGISAQQIQAVMPEVVAPAPIDEKYLTIRYERLVPLLIAAIKELKAEVELLKGVK
jgi:hypothetical protein